MSSATAKNDTNPKSSAPSSSTAKVKVPPSTSTTAKSSALHSRLQSALKRSPPSYRDAVSILTEVRDVVVGTLSSDKAAYSSWLKLWIPTLRDMLSDTSVGVIGTAAKKKDAGNTNSNNTNNASSIKKTVKVHPLFVPVKHDQPLRKCCLDVLARCPRNEVFYEHRHSSTVLGCCVNVLNVDYEENASAALNIMCMIHGGYRTLRDGASSNGITNASTTTSSTSTKHLKECQAFVDFACDCYIEANKSIGGSLDKNFDFGTTPGSHHKPSDPPPLYAKMSLRILMECPGTLVFLFQMYPKALKSNIPTMVPFMIDSLTLVPPRFVDPSSGGNAAATAPNTPTVNSVVNEAPVATTETPKQSTDTTATTPTTGVSTASSPPNESFHRLYRVRVHELLACQVKTLSFLTHLIGSCPDQMRPHRDALADSVVSLMKHCPRDVLSTRREMLLAAKQIIATEFRKGFFRHIDVMMDERIIAGGGERYSAADQSLRPMGYSVVADLIQHARNAMTPAQLGRAVRLYTHVLHDTVGLNMPAGLQIIAARLLLQLADPIYNNNDPDPQVGRDGLYRILSAFVQKFQTIRVRLSGLLEDVEKEMRRDLEMAVDDESSIHRGRNEDGEHVDPLAALRDIQILLRGMFQGMKTIIWCINKYPLGREKERQRILAADEETFPFPPSTTSRDNEEVNSALSKITDGEREILTEYIVSGLPCIAAFRCSVEPDSGLSSSLSPPRQPSKVRSPQYREMIEAYSAAFSLADSTECSNIRRTLAPNLPFIMDEIERDTELIHLFRHMLLGSGKSISYEACDVTLAYLMENIAVLGRFEEEKPKRLTARAQNHYVLFTIVFSSLQKYPRNEVALLPHLCTFIPDSIRRSMELKIWPGPYLCIVRVLFRTLAAVKFEASARELIPLVPGLLNGLYRIYCTTVEDALRSMIIELMLKVPARLQAQLPHLTLQVKIIIPALQSNRATLVDMAMRTLEFWVDTLDPDFLYPVLAQDSDTLKSLMASLAEHLKPSPYPYGMLCLRLLGKLGGKNRLFLDEVVSLASKDKMSKAEVSIPFEWHLESKSQDSLVPQTFPLKLPLERAVGILQCVTSAPYFVASENEDMTTRLPLDSQSEYFKALFHQPAETLDLNSYAVKLMEKTKSEQAKSAFTIIRGALTSVLDVIDENDQVHVPTLDTATKSKESTTRIGNLLCTSALKLVCDGLFVATKINELEEDAIMMLKGLGSHILFVIESHRDSITRTDCDGAVVDNLQAGYDQNHVSSGKILPLQPFGSFRLSGLLGDDANPFAFNESLARALSDPNSERNTALNVMTFLLELVHDIKSSPKLETESSDCLVAEDLFTENLLSSLCQESLSTSWNCRSGLMIAIMELLKKMGLPWSKQFEVEMLHVAMFTVKDAPSEITIACKEALTFFVTITGFFFGGPASWDSGIIYDTMSPKAGHNHSDTDIDADSDSPAMHHTASFTLILSEIGSTKQLARLAVRLFLRIVSRDSFLDSALRDNMTSLKRLIFPRILRNSPLPEQVAIVESIAFMMERAPTVFNTDESTCLSFTAELLKMVSVADGDISDTISSVVLIDKNGFALQEDAPSQERRPRVHASSILRRKSFRVRCEYFGACVVVPEELPLGVMLRVAAIYLFRSIARKPAFFDADVKSQVGNLRPHVISILFRSLISEVEEVVLASESALSDALLLGADSEDRVENPSKSSSHKLPKELIQACIRPILIDLKEIKKLTLPLIRGLSRLLVLLSSMFNKSLGEKILAHLYLFTDKPKIIELQLSKVGEEPKLIASMIDLFPLIPQASRFVEVLIKVTLRLEQAWGNPPSLFREPLARYLNRYCSSAVGFFIEQHRLSNTSYSQLFVDILQRDSCEDLRKYVSTKDSLLVLLNVCFEKPLAVIRSEKSGSHVPLAQLEVHGINPMNSYSSQRKLETARYGIMSKKNKVVSLKLDDHPNFHQARENLHGELENARRAYSKEIAHYSGQKDIPTERLMTVHSLELQLQGFKVIDVLVKFNKDLLNLQDQSDVIRAMRWLWRSRGRHYRLVYDEELQPRYHKESLMLAKFFILYLESNQADTDALFDLIRIFMNPTSVDFTFVKQFLHKRVTCELSLEQKEQVFLRYLTLLSSEGSEDNKVTSTSLLILPMMKQIFREGEVASIKAVISDASIKKLMTLIFHGGAYSSKLTCQLLQLTSVLLEHLHEDISEYRKDILKYVWGVLKSDDTGTKYYGYLAVIRFVAAFETPVKVTLQVYRSLLRSHNTLEKSMVRTALNLLVISLPKRLNADEFQVAIKYTMKIMSEEASSIQQQVHLLECITSHPDVFSRNSSALIPQMMNALSSLGISQTSSSELKELYIVTAKLIFDWNKTEASTPVDGVSKILDALVNYLIKFILLNAEGKSDRITRRVHLQAISLLKSILLPYPNVKINMAIIGRSFDTEDAKEVGPTMTKSDVLTKKGEKTKKPSNKEEIGTKNQGNGITPMVMLASLDILCIVLSCNSVDALFNLNASGVVASCFNNFNYSTFQNKNVQRTLKEFIVKFVSTGGLGLNDNTLISLLENSIVAVARTGESHDTKFRGYLAIDIIEKVCTSYPHFVEPFMSSLASFAMREAAEHIKEVPKSSTFTMTSSKTNIPNATPTLGIFDFACGIGFYVPKSKDSYNSYESVETHSLHEVESLKPALKALIQSLRLLSSSTILSTFSAPRKMYLDVMSGLLDSSSCIPILTSVVAVVGNVLVTSNYFTYSEKEEFLTRIAKIDFIRLPTVTSQILLDMICCIVLSTLGYDLSFVFEYPYRNAKQGREHYDMALEPVIKKIIPICYLSTNKSLRHTALRIFALDTYDCNVVQQHLSSYAAETQCRDGDDIGIIDIPVNCAYDIIYRFLNSDLEYLGNHLSTVVLADLLLVIGNHSRGLPVTSQTGCVELECKLASETIQKSSPYSVFMNNIIVEKSDKNYRRGHLISAIRDIVHGDVATTQSILECCFQAAWGQLSSNEERFALIENIEKLLAMPYHARRLKTGISPSPSNVIQSLLLLVFHLRPTPIIDTLLLPSLTTHYNVHYEVLAYLEKQYTVMQQNRLVDSPESNLALQTIYDLFRYLGDRDTTLAISSSMCSLPGSKFALSLDMHGEVKKSTDAYIALINRADSNKTFMPPKGEVTIWSQRWIEAHRELSQWSLIDEVTSKLGEPSVRMESALKTRNFDKLKLLLDSPSDVSSIGSNDLLLKMSEIALATNDGKFDELKLSKLNTQAAQICLNKWQSLRPGSSGAHRDLYSQFQRLTELRESTRLMIEATAHSSRRSLPDFKTILPSWRLRNPNAFEPMAVWGDLYSWRLYIFDTIASLFNWVERSRLANLHDHSNATIKLARIARKQNLRELSSFLSKDLSTDCMDISDAFAFMREQIAVHQHSSDPDVLRTGLNLVNSTDLTLFNDRHKAEFFRLKSYFYNALNDKSTAHKNLCHTVQICPDYSRAWIDWGDLCASLAEKKNGANESKESKHKSTIQYMAQAIGCYLEAIKCDTSERARENIPHCLSILSLDSTQYGHVFKAFQSRAPLLPAWVWLPWLPQLLASLCRSEANPIKTVLMRIVSDHPQAIYFPLRAFFLERRDIERSKDQKQEDDAQKHAETLMSNLRKGHPVLWSKLEAILEDLIVRFRPSYESELLATIKALIEKAKAKTVQNATSADDTSDKKDALLESLRSNLSKISHKFFKRDKSPESTRGRKNLLFEKQWHAAFDRDFVENQGGLNTSELIEKLGSWKAKLEHHISLVPTSCHLQESSPSLSWYSGQYWEVWPGACDSASLLVSNSQHDHLTLDHAWYEATKSSEFAAHKASSDAVVSTARGEGLGGHEGGGSSILEIPGQYAPTSPNVLDSRPFPELHAKLIRFQQTLEVISSPSKQDQTVRQITMIGSDGKSYKFSLQLAIPYWTRADERSAQMLYTMNKILRRDIQTCRRGLTVRPNAVIPVAQRMRMTANESSYTSLDSVFHCCREQNAKDVVAVFEDEVSKRLGEIEGDNTDTKIIRSVKLDVYRHICQDLVSPKSLSAYMMDIIPSVEHFMQYRKVFASQLAMNSVLQHAFAVIERNPSRFVFCNSTGRIITQDFRFQYNQGLLEAHNVPFRLTRTITDFIGPFLLEGTFIPSFVSTSSALNTKRASLEPILHLLLRDDIMSWYVSKTQPRNDHKMQEMERQLSERVKQNIKYVQERLQDCSVRSVKNAADEAVSENPKPIDHHVRSLVETATDEEKLCLMSPSYQAWL